MSCGSSHTRGYRLRSVDEFANAPPLPLSPLQKLHVLEYWRLEKRDLTPATFAVLLALVRRQNSKSGTCFPSAESLMADTGLRRRAVDGALSKLQEVGAILRNPNPGPTRRKFVIMPVDRERLAEGSRSDNMQHRDAERTAVSCSMLLHEHAARIGERKNKEKTVADLTAETKSVSTFAKRSRQLTLNQIENEVVSLLSKVGKGYEVMQAHPEKCLDLYKQCQSGQITVREILVTLLGTEEDGRAAGCF